MKNFIKSRVGYYLLYGMLMLIFFMFLGFECSILSGIGTILGEMHYQQDLKKKEEDDSY